MTYWPMHYDSIDVAKELAWEAISQENKELEQVDRNLEYVEDCVLGLFYRNETMTMLRAGFSVVCEVNRNMTAGMMLWASCLQGEAEVFIERYKTNNPKQNFVYIPSDAGAIQWFIQDETKVGSN